MLSSVSRSKYFFSVRSALVASGFFFGLNSTILFFMCTPFLPKGIYYICPFGLFWEFPLVLVGWGKLPFYLVFKCYCKFHRIATAPDDVPGLYFSVLDFVPPGFPGNAGRLVVVWVIVRQLPIFYIMEKIIVSSSQYPSMDMQAPPP